jgi:Icc-related predicted phosphoesterase
MNPKKLKIAAVGDIHVHENSLIDYKALFQQIAAEADILLLCGDLTTLGLATEAQKLADDLRDLKIPVLAVLGNHDHHSGQMDEIKKILTKVGVLFLDDEPFEMGDVGFAGTKGFAGGFDNHMLVGFGEQIMKDFVAETISEALILENSLKTLKTKHKIVVLHYSPIAGTLEGEPLEIFPFLGSTRLAEAIDRFEVEAIFHGHAHYGVFEGKTPRGAKVYNCAYEILYKNQPKHPYALIEVGS